MSEERKRPRSSGGEHSRSRASQHSSREGGRERSGRTRRRRSRMHPGLAALLYLVFVIGASVFLASFGWTMANDVLALNKEYRTAVIEVSDDDSIGDITTLLKEKGLIEYPLVFRMFAAVTGAKDDLAAGSYELDTSMDYRAIVINMSARSSTRQTTTVVIPEGYTVAQIFQLLEDEGVSTVEKLNDMAANYDYKFSFLQELPLGEPNRLEGYLFPDTYEFFLGQDPKMVINKMLIRFDAVVTDEMRQKIWDSGRTIQEVVTVASLIEKETDGDDYAKIGSVIYNRLNHPTAETAGFLQIDAAITYVTGRAVTREDYDTVNSPYNTYQNKGLPPTAIANPGMASIYAAMEPANTSYYYYVRNPETGKHEYSRTYDAHIKLVNKYTPS